MLKPLESDPEVRKIGLRSSIVLTTITEPIRPVHKFPSLVGEAGQIDDRTQAANLTCGPANISMLPHCVIGLSDSHKAEISTIELK